VASRKKPGPRGTGSNQRRTRQIQEEEYLSGEALHKVIAAIVLAVYRDDRIGPNSFGEEAGEAGVGGYEEKIFPLFRKSRDLHIQGGACGGNRGPPYGGQGLFLFFRPFEVPYNV
jgi:hypothetical protein